MAALNLLISPPLRYKEQERKFDFKNADEIIQVCDVCVCSTQLTEVAAPFQVINGIMSCLHKGRNALIIPKKRTIEELQSSRNMVSVGSSLIHHLGLCAFIFHRTLWLQ